MSTAAEMRARGGLRNDHLFWRHGGRLRFDGVGDTNA